MKINFLLPHLKLSGGTHVTMAFADLLSQRGHEVTVAVESKSPTRFLRNLSNRHALLPAKSKVKVIRVKEFSDLPEAGIYFADSWRIAKALYDLNVPGAKFQYIRHDERLYHGNPEAVEAVYRLPMKKLVNATWIQEGLKKIGQDSTILFNAVDCNLFNPSKRTRKEYGLVKVLVLHHDFKWKGTKDGVKIVQDLKQRYPNVRLVLYGTRSKKIDMPYDEYYFDVVGKDLARVFANSDIYLGCSIDDSRPIAHRWAMASGATLAIYDNQSVADYAVDGRTALIAQKGDSNELSQKVEQLIVDTELRIKISQEARFFVRSLPTWDQLVDKLENIFKKAILNKQI